MSTSAYIDEPSMVLKKNRESITLWLSLIYLLGVVISCWHLLHWRVSPWWLLSCSLAWLGLGVLAYRDAVAVFLRDWTRDGLGGAIGGALVPLQSNTRLVFSQSEHGAELCIGYTMMGRDIVCQRYPVLAIESLICSAGQASAMGVENASDWFMMLSFSPELVPPRTYHDDMMLRLEGRGATVVLVSGLPEAEAHKQAMALGVFLRQCGASFEFS